MPSKAERKGLDSSAWEQQNLPTPSCLYYNISTFAAASTSTSASVSMAAELSHDSGQVTSSLVHKPDWVEYMSGGGAALMNITITFPLNKVLFRQQLHGIRAKKALRQINREGLRNIYRGVLPPLLQKTCSVAVMFGAYEHFSRIFRSEFPSLSPTAVLCTAALLSGSCEALLAPFERVQTLLQDHRHSGTFKNTPHALRTVYSYSIRECYRGLTAILLRNGPSNIVFFSLRGRLREALPEPTSDAGAVVNDFISGAILGAMLSTAWFPVNVVKTRMQSRVGGKFYSFVHTFREIYVERGCRWRAMFYGVHLNFTRALISWGIINASYEMLKSFCISMKS
ncbi:mitochondrial nicotinamide adenine dinucleotide transporter SLC25A51-like [Diadema antillarum]|uniref:mitochondrial nicotinamide adenine dinucleotide transporter SLC25A51-like n=1 Tax=Diadema antillarum TaxID=105358 RepID=UPI003A8781C1